MDDNRLDRFKIRDAKTCKGFFDIANPAFNTALFIALSHGTGHNSEPIVIGKIEVFGIENGGFTDNMLEHG